ncbi:MAG: cyclic nucleotide-binding/CBS domain-containing protein [Myxococcota bacterium]
MPSKPAEPEDVYAPPHADPDPDLIIADDRPVRELMHEGVLTCGLDTTVEQMASMLLDNKIHAVVVVDDTQAAVGVVSQTDLVLARQGREPSVFRAMKAREIMSPELIACTPDTSITEAVTTMTRRRIHRLVVVEQAQGKRRPVGVVSMTDIVRSMMGGQPDRTPYQDPA